MIGAASAAAPRAIRDQLACAIEPAAESVAVPAGACERRQLRLRAQAGRAELDADLGRLVLARASQPLVDGRRSVRPATLPQREVCAVAVVEAERAVLEQVGARRLEVRPRGVELAAADLDLRADGEERGPEARGDTAERGGAEPVGLVPVADREQRLDLIADEQGARRSRTGESPRAPPAPVAPTRGAGPAWSARR